MNYLEILKTLKKEAPQQYGTLVSFLKNKTDKEIAEELYSYNEEQDSEREKKQKVDRVRQNIGRIYRNKFSVNNRMELMVLFRDQPELMDFIHKEEKESVQSSIEKLIKDEKYQILKPILKYIEIISMTNYSPDIIRGLIDLVKQIKIMSQGNPYEYISSLLNDEYYQWNVKGNVNQNNYNQFKKITIKLLEENLPELERNQPNPKTLLRVVLFVMTRKEAEELASGQAFLNYDQEFSSDFDKFNTLLEQKYTANWINRYHSTREEWQPFSNCVKNIRELLEKILNDANNSSKQIVPRFISPKTLNHKGDGRNQLKILRNHTCLVIIDAISIRHPLIQRAFRQSLLDIFDSTIVATFDPTKDEANNILEQKMINFIEYYRDLECSKRRHWDHDRNCRIVHFPPDLTNLLGDQLTVLLQNKDKPQPSNFLDNLYM